METVDALLSILIVLHLAVEESGQILAAVSEQEQERRLRRFVAAVNFSDGTDDASFAESLKQTVAYERENILLA